MELSDMDTAKLITLAKKIHKLVEPYVKKGVEVEKKDICDVLNNVVVSLKKFKPKKKEGPKRAKSAYFFFLEVSRLAVKTENPGLKLGEQMKIIGSKWRELPESEKDIYIKLSDADKERYNEEIKSFMPEVPDYSDIIQSINRGELDIAEVDILNEKTLSAVCKHFKIKFKKIEKKIQVIKDIISNNRDECVE